MKVTTRCTALLFLLGAFAQAQFPSAIKHVIVVFQENRTPDNLFHDLCTPPWWTGTGTCPYDISTTFVDGTGTTQPLAPVGLATNFDLSHAHSAFVSEKNNPATPLKPSCGSVGTLVYGCTPSTWNQFMYVENGVSLNYNNSYGKGTTHILDPYYTMATQWGWGNFMYQTNQGPSYPAHQFIFGGSSAPTAGDDAAGTFIAENPSPGGAAAGCFAPLTETNFLIDINGNETSYGNNGMNGNFCFNRGVNHSSLAELLDQKGVSWKYYAPTAGSIWTAPNSDEPLCLPNYTTGKCTNPEYASNVIIGSVGNRAQFLKDLTSTSSCNLPAVSWVIPDGGWSDHASSNSGLGPSWVAAIVNGVGNNKTCNYWANTAVVITWDDWGGWYDHEAPYVNTPFPNYNYGFRVPLIVVSGYTPKGFVSNVKPRDFGSVLNMIEGIFLGGEGKLGFADARSTDDLHDFFPGPFQAFPTTPVVAVQDANYFTGLTTTPAKVKDAPIDPDDD